MQLSLSATRCNTIWKASSPIKYRRISPRLQIVGGGRRDVSVFSSRSGEPSRQENDDGREVSGQDAAGDKKAPGESSISDDRNSSNETQNTLVDMLDLETSRSRISRFADQEAKILKEMFETSESEMNDLRKEKYEKIDSMFEEALRSIDEQSREGEEILSRMRKTHIEEKRKFAELEDNINSRRNQGLFFQNNAITKRPIGRAKRLLKDSEGVVSGDGAEGERNQDGSTNRFENESEVIEVINYLYLGIGVLTTIIIIFALARR